MSAPKQVDILGVGETFLNKSVGDKILHIDGYTFERKDRDACTEIDTNNGGCVLIYIRGNINYTRRIDLETSDIESIRLEIKVKKLQVFFILFSIQTSNVKVRMARYCFLADRKIALEQQRNLHIDFKDGNAANNKWKHVIETHELSEHIDTPTRVTAHSEICRRTYWTLK